MAADKQLPFASMQRLQLDFSTENMSKKNNMVNDAGIVKHADEKAEEMEEENSEDQVVDLDDSDDDLL
jgi:hypothetical protein